MQPKVIFNSTELSLTINRLCYQLIENHDDLKETALIGVQPRGVPLCDRICQRLREIDPSLNISNGKLDVAFYRDDFRRRDKPLEVSDTEINFSLENKKVVLIDDVFYTGRTIRAAMDALMDFGRPMSMELLVLVERRFSSHVPIKANYIGKTVDCINSEKVRVEWNKDGKVDRAILYNEQT